MNSQHEEELSIESLLGRAANEYSERLSRGESPEISEFTGRYPQIAQMIEEIFPALNILKEGPSDATRNRAGINPNTQETLGDFRIVGEIGRGGMGIVYEAVQLSLGRTVALKVLPFVNALDRRRLQRFKNEAQAAAQLHHQNIVPVHGIGVERGVHFYAMQLIEGRTLAEIIQDLRVMEGVDPVTAKVPSGLVSSLVSGGHRTTEMQELPDDAERPASGVRGPSKETTQIPQAAITTERSTKDAGYFRRIVELGIQVADALEHAHEEGVIHRDIKPSNLILDGRGKVWVTDFGLALVQADTDLTMTGDLVGTLRYMAPEQALGKRAIVDQRADVYALCATLYELLTLEPLFNGKDRIELINQIASEEPRRPVKLNRAVPHELETIVLKGLEKDPEHRYQAAKMVADDLRRFLEHRPILARRPSPLQRLAKLASRHERVVWSVVGTCVLAVLVAMGYLWTESHNLKVGIEHYHSATFYTQVVYEPHKAIEQFTLAIERLPRKYASEAYRQRGLAHVALREFDLAANDLEMASQLGASYWTWLDLAKVYVLQDRISDYRAICNDALKAQPKSAEFDLPWLFAIHPNATNDYRPVIRLARERMLDASVDPTGYQGTFGALLYRNGELREARETLLDVESQYAGGREERAVTWYFLAMVEARLGNQSDATRWLEKATNWTEEHGHPMQRIVYSRFREEAEGLLRSDGPRAATE